MAIKTILYLAVTLFFWGKTLKQPIWGIVFFTGIFFIRPETVSYYQLIWLRIPLITGILTVLSWFLNTNKSTNPSTRTNLIWMLAVFYGISVASTYFAEVVPLWRWQAAYFDILLFCFLLVKVTTDIDKIKLITCGIIVGALFLSIWGCDQYFRGNYRLEGLGGNRFGSNEIGSILASIFPIWASLGTGRISLFQSSKAKKIERLFFVSTTPLLIATVMFTQSRGAFLGLATAVVLFFWYAKNKMTTLMVIATLLLVILPFAPSQYTARIGTIFNPAIIDTETLHQDTQASSSPDGSIKGRLDFWGYAVRMIEDHPLLGVGPQNFEQLTSQYSSGQYGKKDTHNTYLKIAAELGIPALVLFIALVVGAIGNYAKAIKNIGINNKNLLGYATAYQAALLALSVSGLTSSYNYTEPLYWYIFLSVPILSLSTKENPSKR